MKTKFKQPAPLMPTHNGPMTIAEVEALLRDAEIFERVKRKLARQFREPPDDSSGLAFAA